MMTDPIADMLTRIRNAHLIRRASVDIPLSNLKVGIAKVLEREGFIRGWTVEDLGGPQKVLRVSLKYDLDQNRVIQHVQRVSRPGKRVYAGADGIKKVRKGLGIAVVSTPKGVLSDRECRTQRTGGEVLCELW